MPDKINWDKIKAILEDPLSHEVKVMVGNITAFVQDSRIDWPNVIAATSVTDESRVKIAIATCIRLDGDVDHFISDDPTIQDKMPLLIESHAAMLEAGTSARNKLVNVFKGLVGLLNLIPGI